MAFSDKNVLQDRHRQVLDLWGRRIKKSYRGFSQALRRHSPELFERIDPHLRVCLRQNAGDHWLVEGLCAFAADGSQFDCPRTQANRKGLDCRGKDPLRPSLYCTHLYHLGLDQPWDWRVGPARESEDDHVRDMLPDLPAQALLVMDAGLAHYDLLSQITRSGRHFLVRVGGHVHLLEGLTVQKVIGQEVVHLWPGQRRDQPPLAVYLYKIGSRRHPVWLIADLPLSKKQVQRLYRARWGIEVHHRSIKQTLERRKMLSRSPDLAQWELHWTLCGRWILGLLGLQAMRKAGTQPQTLSPAQTLRVVRQAMAGQLTGGLWAGLKKARQDRYRRKGSKRSRHWPHKKNDKPAGPPHLRIATAAEQQKAQGFCERAAAG